MSKTNNAGISQFDVISLTGCNAPIGNRSTFAAESITAATYSFTSWSTLGTNHVWAVGDTGSGVMCATILKILRDRLGVKIYYNGTNEL